MRLSVLILCAALTMSACGKQGPVAKGADGRGLPAPDNHQVANPGGAPPTAEQPSNAATANGAQTIPGALQGRWGLSPADCTSRRGDAKGLLAISASDLRFYESTAVPGTDAHADAASIAGTFNFTGEGQSWSKYESLKSDRNKLVRTETNPSASFTYAKC